MAAVVPWPQSCHGYKVQFSSVQSLFFLNLNLNLLLQGRTEPEPELNLPELVLLGSVLVLWKARQSRPIYRKPNSIWQIPSA